MNTTPARVLGLLAAPVFFLGLAAAHPAAAQSAAPAFTITLDDPNQTVAQGQTAYFTGTVTNVSGQTEPSPAGFYVNYSVGYYSDTLGTIVGYLDQGMLQKTAYGPGDAYTGPLFSIRASPTQTPGLYDGRGVFFRVSLDSSAPPQFGPRTDVPYSVLVTPSPEPPAFAGLGLGALGLAALGRRARRRAA